MRLGWIGLGNMGVPMVNNATKSGLTVDAYNRTPGSFGLESANVQSSIANTVADKDAVVVMVSDGAAVRNVLFEQAAATHMKSGTLVVNMSTIGVDESIQVAKDLQAAGLRFLEAPVLGSVKPAVDGTLVVVAGGEAEDFQQMQPLFDAVSRAAFLIGGHGKGATMKLLVNAYLGVTMEILGESLVFAAHNDLDPKLTFEVLKSSAVSSPMMAGKEPLILEKNFPAQFALKHLTKDLGLAKRQADATRVTMPSVEATLSTYTHALTKGLGELDMSAIFAYLQDLSANQ